MLLSGYTTTKPCAECKKPFTPSNSGVKFCCSKCSGNNRSRRYRAKINIVPYKKKCKTCLHPFITNCSRFVYCSKQCRITRWIRIRKFIRRTVSCKLCGAPFLKIRSDHRFCSKKCQQDVWALSRRSDHHVLTRLDNCAICGADITMLYGKGRRMYCRGSSNCSEKATRLAHAERRKYMNSFVMRQAERRAKLRKVENVE